MALRCVYTDLDGTLLGAGGSIFRDADGDFTLLPARALEACYRAGVEVVIMSGRREASVMADARLIGRWAEGDGTPAERMVAAGIPDLLFEAFPGRLEWHGPWHAERRYSHLMRGKVDVAEANRLLAEHGHEDLRFLDNGAITHRMEGIEGYAHAYHV